MIFSSEQVVAATRASASAVHAHWPIVCAALDKPRPAGRLVEAAAIATITVECPPWRPISEWGEHPEYDTGRLAARLGNTPEADGDGQKYEGRGFIQLTGRANYRAYGKLLGLDLENEPDLALVPGNAARIFAAYFKSRGVYAAARAQDWKTCRRLVNGGLNGYEKFHNVLIALGVAT